jgi:hypothetical protein
LLVTAPEQTDPTTPTARPTTPSASSDASSRAARGGVLVLGEAGGLGAALLRRLQGNGTAAGSALGLTDSEVTKLLLEGEALRLLIAAGAGLAVALAVEVVLTMIAFKDGFANMVVAIVLVAVFTAALVRRLSRRRLTTVFGPRAAPRSHHVLVVGFGQVGFRLSQLLRERGVPAIGIERDAEAPQVRLAGGAGIPVALGRGDDREVLSRLGVDSCAALAVVTSDDLVNVAVGLAASDLRPGLPIVLRLGDGEVASETDSGLHLGEICDAHKLAAVALAEVIETGA